MQKQLKVAPHQDVAGRTIEDVQATTFECSTVETQLFATWLWFTDFINSIPKHNLVSLK